MSDSIGLPNDPPPIYCSTCGKFPAGVTHPCAGSFVIDTRPKPLPPGPCSPDRLPHLEAFVRELATAADGHCACYRVGGKLDIGPDSIRIESGAIVKCLYHRALDALGYGP